MKSSPSFLKIFGTICAVFALLAGCSMILRLFPQPEPDDAIAYTMATRQLKNPGSAKFPAITDSGVQIDRENVATPYQWRVQGFVDGTNSFGGTIRTRFFVRLHCTDKESQTWQPDEVRLLE
jgi:hypothetical protein